MQNEDYVIDYATDSRIQDIKSSMVMFYLPAFLFSMQRPLQWYQSLDLFVDVGAIRTQGVVGVDVFVATFSRVFRILLDGWI